MEVVIVFFFYYDVYLSETASEMRGGGIWFHPSRIDWIIESWGVDNKMEADLNANLQLVVGDFSPLDSPPIP